MGGRRSLFLVALSLLGGCGDDQHGLGGHVIEIDIDDHGLAGLWMASAPNLKGLIARGTLAFSRVDVPTHSNQNNMTLLTGQYPDGHAVPSNAWLSRAAGFTTPVNLPGLSIGDYAVWNNNPLRTRGDSTYGAVREARGRSAYVGELPPFEVGADEVHLSVVGTTFGPLSVTKSSAQTILTQLLGYPADVASRYHFDGPPAPGESQLRFTLRDAADLVRATSADHPMPAYLFVWDFIGLGAEITGNLGFDGAGMRAIIEDYDAGLGDLLQALGEKSLLESTNIVFTLDHGKVDTHNQVALGTRGSDATTLADGQLAAVVAAQGAAFGVDTHSYALLNEDGDALLYARVAGAGTASGAVAQTEVTHRLVALVQSGAITGVDTTRTMTADGWLGTRRFHDFRANGPNQADLIIFPRDDWTLNQVDLTNTAPGPFQESRDNSYARHGGFSADELYVLLILAGPAFKSGVLLPHPVEHADVAPTALAALGGAVSLRTAARGPIHAALIGDPGETIPLPDPPETARELVLWGSGFAAAPPYPMVATPAGAAIIIDVAGLYDDEVFADPMLAAAAAPLRDLASRGTRFEDYWTRSRDWPVTEYQMLTGGYPVAPWVPAPEDDPTQTFGPGAGLLAMPPPAGHIASQEGFEAWRTPAVFPGESLFDAAHTLGLTTALLGDSDFHALHLDPAAIDVAAAPGTSVGDQLTALAADHPRFLALVAIGGGRTANRHDRDAMDELDALSKSVADLAARVPDVLIVVTSRGATPIEDPGSDFYGAGSSRHVPLLLIGPGIRAGVVSGQPAAPADLPATLLFGLGAASATDFALGTWAAGTPRGGVPQPMPSGASEGHALLRAFSLAGQ
jgi:hypothetical protein